MAEFDFDALSLIEDVERETTEASKARKEFANTVQVVGDEHLRELVEYGKEVSDLAAQQAAVHESILADKREADRIQESVFLNIMAPTLEQVAPNLTVKGRMSSMGRKAQESKILEDKFRLTTKQREINEQKRLQRLKNAQAGVTAEEGDVTDAQRRLANARAFMAEGRAIKQEERAAYLQQAREREEALTTVDDPQSLLGQKGVTKQMVREEELRRQAKEDSVHLSKQARTLGDRKMELLARQKELESMTFQELDNLATHCEKSGVAVSPGQNTFQCGEIAQAMTSKKGFRDAMIEARVQMDVAEEELDSIVKGIARGHGTPMQPGVGVDAYLEVLATDPTLEPETRAKLTATNARLKEARAMEASFLDKAEQIDKLMADAKEAETVYQTKRLATASKPHVPAMTEYMLNGEVDSIDHATSSAVFALQTQDSTGNKIYDSGLALIPALASEIAASDTTSGKVINEMINTPGEVGLAYQQVLRSSSARDRIATRMWEIGAFDLYRLAAIEMKDEEFVALMNRREGTIPGSASSFYNATNAGVEFQMNRMFNYLNNADKMENFNEAVNRIIDKYTAANFSPQGRNGHIAASVDRTVFGNDTQAWFKYKTRQHIQSSWGATAIGPGVPDVTDPVLSLEGPLF